MEDQITVSIKPIARAKKFVSDHKVAIAVGVTASICLTLHTRSLRTVNEFLAEKGLLEEFYLPENYNGH